jgi:hypothetical protein
MVNILPATPAATQAGEVAQAEPLPPVLPQGDVPALALHIRKTHLNESFLSLFKAMSLPLKLRKNKEIETDNEKRMQKTLDNARDPTLYPDSGSEAASFVTIDSTEMSLLATPDFHDVVQKEAPFFIIRKLAELKGFEKEKRKRDAEGTETSDADETRDSKRHTMSGAVLVSRNAELPIEINFPDIMFDTEELVAIPLPFFTHRSLQHILDFNA